PYPDYWNGDIIRVLFAGDNAIADWLISPVINCSNETSVTFTYNQRHSNSASNPDSALVLGSIDGGITWPYTIAIYDTSVGALNHPDTATFDISGWASGSANVKIAFRLDGYYVLSWYIDEPTVTGDFSGTLLYEDFNSDWGPFGNNPPEGWTIINEEEPAPADGNDWSRYNYSSWGSIAARVNHTPSEYQNDWLITPALSFNAMALCSLSFHVNYWDDDFSPGNETDSGFVLGSIDGGVTWPYEIAVYAGADEGGSDFEDSYRAYEIPWAQNQDQVKIAFKYVGIDGWWFIVDDVTVKQVTLFNDNIATTSIDYPTEFMLVGDSYDPKVTVQNLGSTTQSFDLNLSIEDFDEWELYNETESGISLDPLEIAQVTFSIPFSPSGDGEYTFTATAINPDDENSDDDISSVIVAAYQHQGGGGPDDFGYIYLDNTTQDGPEFNWIDISSTGTQIEPTLHYFMSDELPIGFNFEFYGGTYSSMWVNSHGSIHLGQRDVWLSTNDCPLPDSTSPHVPMMLVHWDRVEIKYEEGQGVYYQYFDDPENDYMIVQWQATPYGEPGNTLEYEVIFYQDGTILYQYNSMSVDLPNGQGQEATIGLEDETYPAGLSYLCNDDNIANRLEDSLAIMWFKGQSGYEYLPGDVNMATGVWPPMAIGSDVTYLVNYFRGLETNPACLLDGFWGSADANGDCIIIGSDVTKLVNFFRGQTAIIYCPNYEPLWLSTDDLPPSAPTGWPNCE
ncbi:MAG: hypothetical protein GY839_11930, partial [candidate division Zixibacteria bacterium]|nr:hypothetical protein [candidate division Zixibacteria bacterium]